MRLGVIDPQKNMNTLMSRLDGGEPVEHGSQQRQVRRGLHLDHCQGSTDDRPSARNSRPTEGATLPGGSMGLFGQRNRSTPERNHFSLGGEPISVKAPKMQTPRVCVLCFCLLLLCIIWVLGFL